MTKRCEYRCNLCRDPITSSVPGEPNSGFGIVFGSSHGYMRPKPAAEAENHVCDKCGNAVSSIMQERNR